MNKWLITYKDKETEIIEADMFQPTGAMITFYKLSAVSGPRGEQGGEPVFVVNVSEVRSIKPAADGGVATPRGPRLVGV